MRWLAVNVAWHCLNEGWPRWAVPEAVGRAWQVSKLDDSWQYPDPPGVSYSYTGLWGFNTTGWQADDRANLTRVDVAAAYAFTLWDISGHEWDWCPDPHDYSPGFWTETLPDLVAQATPDLDISGRVNGPVYPEALVTLSGHIRRAPTGLEPGPLRFDYRR